MLSKYLTSNLFFFLFLLTTKIIFLLLVWLQLQRSNKLNNSLFLQNKVHVLWRNLSGHRMAKRCGPLVMTEETEGGERGDKISNLGCTVNTVRASPWIFTPFCVHKYSGHEPIIPQSSSGLKGSLSNPLLHPDRPSSLTFPVLCRM